MYRYHSLFALLLRSPTSFSPSHSITCVYLTCVFITINTDTSHATIRQLYGTDLMHECWSLLSFSFSHKVCLFCFLSEICFLYKPVRQMSRWSNSILFLFPCLVFSFFSYKFGECSSSSHHYSIHTVSMIGSCGSGGRAGCLLIRRAMCCSPAHRLCLMKYPWARCWTLSCPRYFHMSVHANVIGGT